MRLDDAIAAINAALLADLPSGLAIQLDGVALPFHVQRIDGGKGARTVNLLDNGTRPAVPDDNYDIHLFHLVPGSEYTQPLLRQGRQTEQNERATVVLIAYTTQPPLADYLGHKLASYPGVELRRLERAPDLVTEKYLHLEKQPNASGPRQLFALTYLLDCQPPLGGVYCPTFNWLVPEPPQSGP